MHCSRADEIRSECMPGGILLESVRIAYAADARHCWSLECIIIAIAARDRSNLSDASLARVGTSIMVSHQSRCSLPNQAVAIYTGGFDHEIRSGEGPHWCFGDTNEDCSLPASFRSLRSSRSSRKGNRRSSLTCGSRMLFFPHDMQQLRTIV